MNVCTYVYICIWQWSVLRCPFSIVGWDSPYHLRLKWSSSCGPVAFGKRGRPQCEGQNSLHPPWSQPPEWYDIRTYILGMVLPFFVRGISRPTYPSPGHHNNMDAHNSPIASLQVYVCSCIWAMENYKVCMYGYPAMDGWSKEISLSLLFRFRINDIHLILYICMYV